MALYGSEKLFRSIHSLVTHLSIMKESLPCTLDIYMYASNTSEDNGEVEDIIDLDSAPELEEIVRRLQKQMMCE